MWMLALSQLRTLSIYSPSLWAAFLLYCLCFDEHSVKVSVQSSLSALSFIACDFDVTVKESLPHPRFRSCGFVFC